MKLKISILIVLAFLMGVAASMYSVGSRMSAPATMMITLPADLGAEPVQFTSASGAKIVGSWLNGKPGMPALILMHGVRANRLAMLSESKMVNEAGYHVLFFDFQAHGESSGERISFGYRESFDAQAAVEYVRQRMPGVKIGAIGRSMGGAASLLGEGPIKVDALLLEEVYPNIEAAVGNRVHGWVGPLSTLFTPLFLKQIEWRLGIAPKEISPIDKIGQLTCPLMIFGGTADLHTPESETRALFARAPEPKKLVMFEGAGHQDLSSYDPKKYSESVLGFFAQTLLGQ